VSLLTDGRICANIPNEQLDFQQLLAKAHYFYARYRPGHGNCPHRHASRRADIARRIQRRLHFWLIRLRKHPLIVSHTSKEDAELGKCHCDKASLLAHRPRFRFAAGQLRLFGYWETTGIVRSDSDRRSGDNPNFFWRIYAGNE